MYNTIAFRQNKNKTFFSKYISTFLFIRGKNSLRIKYLFILLQISYYYWRLRVVSDCNQGSQCHGNSRQWIVVVNFFSSWWLVKTIVSDRNQGSQCYGNCRQWDFKHNEISHETVYALVQTNPKTIYHFEKSVYKDKIQKKYILTLYWV